MPEARRREIADVARAHGLRIIEDDVHGLLATDRPAPLTTLAPELSYYLTSTSKTLAPGLRIAYVAAPPADVPRLAASLRATTWAVAPLTAAVASHWIRDGTADRILEARRQEAREQGNIARSKIAASTSVRLRSGISFRRRISSAHWPSTGHSRSAYPVGQDWLGNAYHSSCVLGVQVVDRSLDVCASGACDLRRRRVYCAVERWS
jgi:hypothetical protein